MLFTVTAAGTAPSDKLQAVLPLSLVMEKYYS